MTSAPSGERSRAIGAAKTGFAFPKSARLLRRKDFLRVYEQGLRVNGPYFTAFYARREAPGRARVGLAAPRALGKAVVRNRIKRRLREAVRLRLGQLPSGWDVVLHARAAVATAPFEELLKAVENLFARVAQQDPQS